MENCSTCKYWQTSVKDVKTGLSNCDLPDTTLPKGEPFMEIEASADDDSNMNVVLMTSANFGCIAHKPKI